MPWLLRRTPARPFLSPRVPRRGAIASAPCRGAAAWRPGHPRPGCGRRWDTAGSGPARAHAPKRGRGGVGPATCGGRGSCGRPRRRSPARCARTPASSREHAVATCSQCSPLATSEIAGVLFFPNSVRLRREGVWGRQAGQAVGTAGGRH